MGILDYNGPAYRFEKTPSRLRAAAPCLGADTVRVLTEILGLSPGKVDELSACGVLR